MDFIFSGYNLIWYYMVDLYILAWYELFNDLT